MQPSAGNRPASTGWLWLLIALGAHTGWGIYPVLARYLQTVSNLPSISLLVMGNLLVLLVLAVTVLPRLDGRALRSPILWLFAGVVVIRSITNLLSARYTLAIYVQLVNLTTPFLVVLLSTTFWRERLPPYTGRAIMLSVAGALLMMSGDVGEAVTLPGGREHGLGLSLAFASSLSLALYMILVRRTVQHRVPGQAVLVMHVAALLLVSIPLSLLLGEEWGQWRQLGLADWLVFLAFSVGVLLGANLGQIVALRRLGAPLVSSLLAWRLVSALVVAAWLLGERLHSPRQLLGAAIVLVTISWYLWQQR